MLKIDAVGRQMETEQPYSLSLSLDRHIWAAVLLIVLLSEA